MSWQTRDWERRDREVSDEPAASIYFPRRDDRFLAVMEAYLLKRNLGFEAAIRYGWYPTFYHGPRIIIPCVRTDSMNFWQGRLLDTYTQTEMMDRPWKRWDSPHGKRGDALTYLHQSSQTVVIVEGPMDALAAAMTGAAAIAILGVGAPGPVLAHVATLAQNFKKVILVPDLDEVPQWLKIQAALANMGISGEIRIPRAKDLADLCSAAREELLHG